ncbi:unnamed protein product, partial [Meganyctiphanes norvegica]
LGDKNGYWCEICQIGCDNDENTINNHNTSIKHVKKEAGQQMLLKLSEEYDCLEHDPKSGTFRCMICNIGVTSPQLMESHFTGSKHRKKAEDHTTNGNANADGKPAAAESLTDPAAGTEGEYWCKVCKLQGKSTPELITKHLATAKHKKKVASSELMEKLRQQEDCFVQDPVSSILKCLVCSLDIPSPHQLESHLAGANHKRKAQGKTAGNEGEEVATDGYWCQICKLSGKSTPTSIDAHIKGAKHLRKVAGNDLLQKLKETTDCFDHDEETGLLNCKVCNIDMNTPQLLEVHLGGFKHKMRAEGKNPLKKEKHENPANPNPEDAERIVFLRNMSHKSTEEEIRTVFEDCGEIESLHCIKDFKGNSKGYGYILFKDKESAVKALEKDKTVLEEHPIGVMAYNPDHPMYVLAYDLQPQKEKLFVTGLPTIMTEKEIRNLFEPHGKIKEIKMLMQKKKFKGLCYIDYADEETAASVKEATDKYEVAPDKKISVRFAYPPRPRKEAAAAATVKEAAANNIDAATEVVGMEK